MPMVSHNVRELKKKALASFRSSVTAFNSLEEDGRLTRVLLGIQHAFEMLLKAALEQKKVSVFDKRSQKSISLEIAIRQAQQTNGIKLSEEEAGTIRVLDALRDAEQHWYVFVDEGLLYLYLRAGITLFEELMYRVFGETLAEHIPLRVLPVSAEPPQDLQILVDREYERVAELLKPGRRGGAEANARIRTLLAAEALTDPDASEIREGDVKRVARGIRAGKSRRLVFPKLDGVGTAFGGSGVTVEVRMVKRGGLPVTFTSIRGGDEPAAIRMVDLEKKFYMSATELAARVGLTPSKSMALRRHLGLDANDDHYSHQFVFGPQKLMRYSDNALRAMQESLPNVDLARVWGAHRTRAHNAPKGEAPPRCDQPGCVGADPR